MGLNFLELSFDLSPVHTLKPISEFLKELSMIKNSCEKLPKLQNYIKQLEDEMRKIDAFKRELPLSMLLLNEAIVRLKEEAMQCKEPENRLLMEEFIPLKGNCDEDERAKSGNDYSDKKSWMSSAQLWNPNNDYENNQQDSIIELKNRNEEYASENPFQLCNNRNRGGAFVPFKGNSSIQAKGMKEVPIPRLSLMPPIVELESTTVNSKSNDISIAGSGLLINQTKVPTKSQQQQQHQQQNQLASRKQRRCWSPELHRRFVSALQQLGGSQVATPKQIRELMQVDGLTNDEVKSHLQKYRLHVQKLPASQAAPANGAYMSDDQFENLSTKNNSLSSSPQGHFHRDGFGKGMSTTGGDSFEEEEDERSEGHSWKGRFYKAGDVACS